jgi:uncharacterized protein YkwD
MRGPADNRMDSLGNTVLSRLGALRAVAVALVVALPLSACISLFNKPEELISGAAPAPATVDPAAAARLISDYRRSHGLSPVTLNPQLMAIAAKHSRAMASADKMSHVLAGEGSFERRLSAGGYDAAIAAENVAAGHRNLDEAFAGWKASPGHNANMLKPGVTQMGIAVAYAQNSKYGNFWTLVLAEPDNRQAALGPDAGPVVTVPR